jgi:hypothetical protein
MRVLGDINIACCVTSVIAQNPYTFTGGTNARDFTYLTQHDVTRTTSSLLPALQTQTAKVTIVETCQADSYSVTSVAQAITTYSTHFGKGILTRAQFFVVGSTEKQGVILTLYVVGRWTPFFPHHFPTTGK